MELAQSLMEATKKNKVFEVNLESLDDSQRLPVLSESENVLLRAPAGSGKTKSLITAIAAYRYLWMADRICAITYTRAARAEMEMRLQNMGIFDVEVTTIHVWARNLLQHFSVLYDFKIKVLEEPQIKDILQEIVEQYLLTSKIKKINIGIVYSFITGNKNMDITDGYKRTLTAIEDRYIQYKRNNLLYDFTDYPLYLYDVLKAYNETIKNIDALFVDEFQDVDSTQLELFNKVQSKKKFYVGDAWQSIFQFRGADGEVFKKTTDFTEYKLKHNYRSYQEIIDYASNVYLTLLMKIDYNDDLYVGQVLTSKPSDILCERGYGGEVYVVNPFGRAVTFDQDCFPQKIDMNKTFNYIMEKNPMILCRTNKQVKEIQDSKYFEVSTVHQAKGLEYNNVIVIDFTIGSSEDLNIAYVAITRARDRVMIINWVQFEKLFEKWVKENEC